MEEVHIPEEIIFPRRVEQKMSSRDFMESVRSFQVPPDKIAQWFLGQNSFLLKTPGGTLVAIDPYLTDYCASRRTGERNQRSRILPVFIEPEDLQVDILALTHSHCDHADPYTLERYSHKESTIFLAPWQATLVLSEAGVPDSRVHLMHPLQSWKGADLEITGTFAQPTDTKELNHMGFVFRFANGLTYWNSGDTAPNELLAHVKDFTPDWISICINGGAHNLSHWDAAAVTAQVKPKIAVPAHYDMMPHNVQPPHMFRASVGRLDSGIEIKILPYYEPTLFL